MLDPKRKPVPLPDEMQLVMEDNAEITLTVPDAPPSQDASAGGSGGLRRLKAIGRLHLTDHRVCLTFVCILVNLLTFPAHLRCFITKPRLRLFICTTGIYTCHII